MKGPNKRFNLKSLDIYKVLEFIELVSYQNEMFPNLKTWFTNFVKFFVRMCQNSQGGFQATGVSELERII